MNTAAAGWLSLPHFGVLQKKASLYEACLDGGAEIVQLIRRVTDIMVEAIKQSEKRNAYQSPVS